MPLLQVNTNASVNDKTAFISTASHAVADMLGKPESYVMVILNSEASMSFAGGNEPCAHLKLKSLGLDESATAAYSQTLCELIERELGVSSSRIYIEFSGPPRHMWGWDKRTF